MELPRALLSPNSKNRKKSTLKKVLVFSKKTFLVFQETELSSPKN